MDISTFSTLVGSFGFPIVACFSMGWYVKYQTDKYQQQIEKLTQEHREEMNKVTEALNNNTLAIQKLCNKLSGEENE